MMHRSLQEAISFIEAQQEKGRTLFLEVWANSEKIVFKETPLPNLEYLVQLLETEDRFIRIKVYWKYGVQPLRHLHEFSYHPNITPEAFSPKKKVNYVDFNSMAHKKDIPNIAGNINWEGLKVNYQVIGQNVSAINYSEGEMEIVFGNPETKIKIWVD